MLLVCYKLSIHLIQSLVLLLVLFGNNSGKSEPMGIKFYRETFGQVASSLQTFGSLRQTAAKWQ